MAIASTATVLFCCAKPNFRRIPSQSRSSSPLTTLNESGIRSRSLIHDPITLSDLIGTGLMAAAFITAGPDTTAMAAVFITAGPDTTAMAVAFITAGPVSVFVSNRSEYPNRTDRIENRSPNFIYSDRYISHTRSTPNFVSSGSVGSENSGRVFIPGLLLSHVQV
ncbi:hypothetical protein ISN44_As13g005100 [Arabidopsis suecica]|uniref:Uncharacterized protein n=1 Tax=Arabidopsis suecica TaxID=45249 RepID=A0A8T1XPS6_ARASU|nr:hypothetical protein ISN44_As13g005100 [Arabidopsis suecica]